MPSAYQGVGQKPTSRGCHGSVGVLPYPGIRPRQRAVPLVVALLSGGRRYCRSLRDLPVPARLRRSRAPARLQKRADDAAARKAEFDVGAAAGNGGAQLTTRMYDTITRWRSALALFLRSALRARSPRAARRACPLRRLRSRDAWQARRTARQRASAPRKLCDTLPHTRVQSRGVTPPRTA